jgi:hypothetical protein
MTGRKEQPAQLKRKIERLEALLKAEQERSQKAFDGYGYRAVFYELVEAKQKLEMVKAVLDDK